MPASGLRPINPLEKKKKGEEDSKDWTLNTLADSSELGGLRGTPKPQDGQYPTPPSNQKKEGAKTNGDLKIGTTPEAVGCLHSILGEKGKLPSGGGVREVERHQDPRKNPSSKKLKGNQNSKYKKFFYH